MQILCRAVELELPFEYLFHLHTEISGYCPRLDPPRNGQLRETGRAVGNVLSFSCNTGYKLKGSQYRQCRPDGRWNGNKTSCTGNVNVTDRSQFFKKLQLTQLWKD